MYYTSYILEELAWSNSELLDAMVGEYNSFMGFACFVEVWVCTGSLKSRGIECLFVSVMQFIIALLIFFIFPFYSDITEESFRKFIVDLLKRVHIEALFHGNLTKEVGVVFLLQIEGFGIVVSVVVWAKVG